MNQLLGKRLAWPLQILVWVLSFYIAWNLIPHGIAKLQQESGIVEFFNSIGVPMSMMLVAGVIESLGSLLLFVPQVSFYAAGAVFMVMCTATYYSHGTDSITYTAAILAFVIAFLSRPLFLRKSLPITKISI